ncbi:MAG: radical SAM protein [Candidatus Diapherotrites archaeon]
MQLKFLFIYPRLSYPSGDFPLGIAYLSAVAKKAGAQSSVIDTTFNPSWEFIEKKIAEEKADVAGLYAMTSMAADALKAARLAKANGATVLLGGPHATILPKETLEAEKSLDAVIVGEGEPVVEALVKSKGKLSKGIPNLVWRDGKGKIIENKAGIVVENLDVLPFPDWDSFDIGKYVSNWFQLDAINPFIKGLNVIASRGCPYNCTYCQPTLRKIFGAKIRQRSPQSVVAELTELKKRFGIRGFNFADDTFIFNKKWVEEFCDLLIEKNLGFLWGCNVRANLITEKDRGLLKKMFDSGLRQVFMGLESGSQRILDEIYRKGITLEQVKTAVKLCNEYNLKTRGYFIIGAPTETLEEIEQTISFAKSLDIEEATFSLLNPLPGTFIEEMSKEKGWLIEEDWACIDYYKKSPYKSGTLPEKELKRLQRKALFSFYLSPKRWGYLLKSFLSPQKMLFKLKRVL